MKNVVPQALSQLQQFAAHHSLGDFSRPDVGMRRVVIYRAALIKIKCCAPLLSGTFFRMRVTLGAYPRQEHPPRQLPGAPWSDLCHPLVVSGDVLTSDSYRNRRGGRDAVVGFHGGRSVEELLHVFSEEDITSAPVWNSEAKYLGFIDIRDVVVEFLQLLRCVSEIL